MIEHSLAQTEQGSSVEIKYQIIAGNAWSCSTRREWIIIHAKEVTVQEKEKLESINVFFTHSVIQYENKVTFGRNIYREIIDTLKIKSL